MTSTSRKRKNHFTVRLQFISNRVCQRKSLFSDNAPNAINKNKMANFIPVPLRLFRSSDNVFNIGMATICKKVKTRAKFTACKKKVFLD